MIKDSFQILIIGDTGAADTTGKDPVLELLKNKLPETENSALIFLGDNVYPKGIPPEDHPLRKLSEKRLNVQLEAIKDYKGKIIFISGNHDWNKGKKNGYEYVLRQEKYIESYLKNKELYYPSGGCPGPEEIKISDYLTLVVINTQWWVTKGFRPIGKHFGCCVETEIQFFQKLEEILCNNLNKRVLVLGHLPIYSYGMHGGNFLWKHHLFPFTLFRKKAYFPLPGIGSLLPLYRKYIGAREDISHPRYRRLRKQLKGIFQKFPNIIYAAGHEHNLQYIPKNGNHYIVSGSGSRLKYVKKGSGEVFTKAENGFFKLTFNYKHEVFAEAWGVGEDEPKLLFERKII